MSSDVINVDTAKLRQYADDLTQVRKRISAVDNRLDSLFRKTGLVDLNAILKQDELCSNNTRLKYCKEFLEITANNFELAEEKILLYAVEGTAVNSSEDYQTLSDVLRSIPGVVLGTSVSAINAFSNFWTDFRNGFPFKEEGWVWEIPGSDEDLFGHVLEGSLSASAKLGLLNYKNKKAKRIHEQDKKKDPGKQVNSEETWYDKRGTIAEIKAEHKAEGSVFHVGAEGESEYAQGSADLKILTGEIHAEAAAGLYVYDKDGKKVFSPAVSAEIGASASVFEVSADGRVGLGENNDMLGLYGEVDAKALTAEAKAGIGISKGQLKAEASAEADLVKVTGSAGVSVLGADIGVTGSLKVGVGAHAEVGFVDGKLKCDIGAAVGVGFDLGFEVDVGGMVDTAVNAVTDCANAVWDFFF